MKRVRIRVFGNVQGVFYRHFAKRMARSLKLRGWCRNDGDGTVLLVVEGENEKVDKFVAWCYEGSPMAKVEHVETSEEAVTNEDNKFEVR